MSAVVRGHCQIKDFSRLDRLCQLDRRELLGAADVVRFGQDAPRRADFAVEMLPQRQRAALA
jgi:hypothetical protein